MLVGGSALFRTPLPFVSSQAVYKMADQEKNDVNETFRFSIRPGDLRQRRVTRWGSCLMRMRVPRF